MASEPRAVLWDMDGTLIDSEEFHWISWRDTMREEGVTITRDQFQSSFGQRNDSIIPQLLGAAAVPERITRIGDAKEELYRALVKEKGVAPLPGVTGWLHRLREQGWLQAVASSAPRLNIEVILDVLGAADCFQEIVSAEDVRKGKPDPEVYLVAASRLGVRPARCIVVEDAAAGIAGAHRAGMRSIGVNRNSGLLKADTVVTSLNLLETSAFERLVAE